VIDPAREGDAVGRLLVSRRYATAAQVEAARKEAIVRGGRIATAYLAAELVDLDTLASLLGEAHDLDAAGPDAFAALPAELVGALPAKVAIRHLAVPVRSTRDVLEVAFVDPLPQTIDVRAQIAPEPLVYFALRKHYGLARVPKSLERLVEAIARGTVRRHAGAIPEAPEEYVTTPMGGVVPHTPDEVTTNPEIAALAFSLEDVLLGAGGKDPLGRAAGEVALAPDARGAWEAVLAYSGAHASAAALLARADGEWTVLAAAGELSGARGASLGEAKRSLLEDALGLPDGVRGAPPDTPATALLLQSLDREPRDVLLVPLCTARGGEVLLWADGGASASLESARVEEMRTLARRARTRFEE